MKKIPKHRKRASSKQANKVRVKKSKLFVHPKSGKLTTRKAHERKVKKYPNPYYTHRMVGNELRLVKVTRLKNGRETVEVVEDRRKGSYIEQSRKVKQQHYQRGYYPGTMEKEVPHNLAKGVKEIGKDEYEHSIAIDFERKIEQPQRMAIVEGGKTETLRIDDFEVFGHTHPGEEYPRASTADIRSMKYLEPEFIVAGKSGRIFIYNIEDPKKYQRWIQLHENRRSSDYPITYGDLFLVQEQKKYKDNPEAQKVSVYNYEQSKIGREMFYEATGVRIYPYKKGTVIEMKDDPHFEKQMPTIPESYQKKYHKQRKEHEKKKQAYEARMKEYEAEQKERKAKEQKE